MIRNEKCYLYREVTTLTDFTHLFEFRVTAIDVNTDFDNRSLSYVWAVSTAQPIEFCSGTPTAIGVYVLEINVSTNTFRLYLIHGVCAVGDPSSSLNVGTTYYVTVTKSGATVTCTIYSDSNRTIVIDTLTMDLTGRLEETGSFNYVQTGLSAQQTSDGNDQSDGYVENLHLNIASWESSVKTTDPEETITDLLNDNINEGTYDITEDDGSTLATFAAQGIISTETVKESLLDTDVIAVVSHGEAMKEQIGLQVYEERIPINIDIYVLDKYSSGSRVITGTKLRWKTKDEIIKLLKASTITIGGSILRLHLIEDEDDDITTQRPYLYHSIIKAEVIIVRFG